MTDQQGLDLQEDRDTTVECLGLTFEGEEARRAHFLEILAEKLKDPEFRKIPGFPEASDEDILRLSDSPYYTACPNPFLADAFQTQSDHFAEEPLRPYSADFKVDKRDPVYLYHPYHTKVPPDVIRTLVDHYTDRGDAVLDVFSGSGMSGVAANSIGRTAVLADLSPVATFIAGINTRKQPHASIVRAIKRALEESQHEYQWMFQTEEGGSLYKVNYFVRTDVFTCPECVFEFPFFPHGVVHHGNKVTTRKSFPCPSCNAELNVRRVERVLTHEGKKSQLAWVNAGRGKKRFGREPHRKDLEVQARIDAMEVPAWHPTVAVDPDGYSARLAQLGAKQIDDVSKFLSKRNLIVFADLWNRCDALDDPAVRRGALSLLTSSFTVISERQGYFGGGGGMSGNLYMPIVRMERNVWDSVRRKIRRLNKAEKAKDTYSAPTYVTTQTATDLRSIPDASIDYVYTDPPFGANIIYSEMNRVLESWLRVLTDDSTEAVIDESRDVGRDQYAQLMVDSFRECYRLLKPGHWITVEFHNTKAAIWNLIQSALGRAGFVVAQVVVLDKGSTTILADIRPGAAKHDLLISAYRPSAAVEEAFALEKSDMAVVGEFVREHLTRLPVTQQGKASSASSGERLPHMLFDRVVAFHVRHGVEVPSSIDEFYEWLGANLASRDGMFFTTDQATEYDKWKSRGGELGQLELFVQDEESALRWVRNELERKAQTYQELHPRFLKELKKWADHEEMVELREILEQNFLRYDGTGPVPSPIHSYLSSNFKDLRNLEKDAQQLRAKAKDRWYVPDPAKQADLEKLREKALLKEFEEYKVSKKKLKQFRTEAVRAGFKACYDEDDYRTIVAVGDRLPESVLQEDEKLLMYYDVASMRLGD